MDAPTRDLGEENKGGEENKQEEGKYSRHPICLRRVFYCTILPFGRPCGCLGTHTQPDRVWLARGRGTEPIVYSFVCQERNLKNFSKRTGNWKLIILTTWDSRRKSCAASTPSVSRNRHPSSRRESFPSFREKTQLHRPNPELVRRVPSRSAPCSAWTRLATTPRRSSLRPPVSSPCRSPSWCTPSVSSSASRCTPASAAPSSAKTSVCSSRASTSSWVPLAVCTT
mmetsp:Transcript_23892/g.29720  ORF Transcript_23892/g.29720 Transcript_23892/m.29720 type:complete len:226 (-) Transcript_23892:1410-2087(-)